MSLETWMAEFYPKPASETTEDEAVAHSLEKWIGLRPENLAKHGVARHSSRAIYDPNDPTSLIFKIDAESCALCRHFLREAHVRKCVDCPLAGHLGTEDWVDEGGCDEPYRAFTRRADPEPMISALTYTLAEQEENEP